MFNNHNNVSGVYDRLNMEFIYTDLSNTMIKANEFYQNYLSLHKPGNPLFCMYLIPLMDRQGNLLIFDDQWLSF